MNVQTTPTRRKLTHYCTECGKTGATVRNRDAANLVHWFHPACLAALAAWVRGESQTTRPGQERR